MTYYRVTFTTKNGYNHTDSFTSWSDARSAYALAVATHGAATFAEVQQ
jgi:hypothetical protein